MCGIAGFWQAKATGERPLDILERMGASLSHRGPDDSGLFYDAAAHLGLAFRRLSIIDLSPEGHQPMTSRSGRYVIIFNGEIYNYEEIRAELPTQPWRGHSDTEVMLAAFEQLGVDRALQRFVGMFAFALWDKSENRLCLVRDRLGIKPLYYGAVNGSFVFASELKAIQQFPGFDAQIDRDVLALYMRFAYVPSPHCIYRGIYKLPPGHILAVQSPADQPVLTPYWSATEIAKAGLQSPLQGTDSELIDQLEEKLLEAVRLRMIADVPLGAFLSGGIDSSTVVALMQSQSTRPVKTFTIGFHEDAYNEAVHAKQIARHLGTEHTELYVTPRQALDVVPLLPSMYDEPFADSSQIPTHLVSKLAREHVTVSLSGDGGDELFGGYGRFVRTDYIANALRRTPAPVAAGIGKLIQSLPPQWIDRSFAFLPWTPKSLQSAPGNKFHKLGDYLRLRRREEIYIYALSQWSDPEGALLDVSEPNTVFKAINGLKWVPTTAEMGMITDLTNYLPDDILTKLDRASMAVALEARVPLLDHRVVEFAWRLPLRLKIRARRGKWILRQVLYRHVPKELLERPKMGVSVPMDQWLRGPLRQWGEDLLAPDNLKRSGFFNVAAVRKKWKEHLSGARNWDTPLWTVLVFQDWVNAQHSQLQAQPVQLSVGEERPGS